MDLISRLRLLAEAKKKEAANGLLRNLITAINHADPETVKALKAALEEREATNPEKKREGDAT